MLCVINYIHKSNIIHRDLKPGSILVDPVTLVVKICDFGMARTMPESVSKQVEQRDIPKKSRLKLYDFININPKIP